MSGSSTWSSPTASAGISDLGYRSFIEEELPAHELVGDQVKQQLLYYPTVTREPFRNQGRVTDLLESGKLSPDLGLPQLDAEHDRVMICGSPTMLKDVVTLLESRGFDEGNSDRRGAYVIERAFVESRRKGLAVGPSVEVEGRPSREIGFSVPTAAGWPAVPSRRAPLPAVAQ